jgi:cell division protein FtsB
VRPDEKARQTRLRRRNLVAALGILALLALSIASFESYRDLRMGRGRELELRREISATEGRIESLEQRVSRLRDDPATLEQLAREELMMARPGEVVIVLPEEPAPEAVERGSEGEGARGQAGREVSEG